MHSDKRVCARVRSPRGRARSARAPRPATGTVARGEAALRWPLRERTREHSALSVDYVRYSAILRLMYEL